MGKQENSKHISVWIENEVLKECEANQKLMGLRSRNEYIEQALKFYNGYLHDKNNEDYINKKVENTLKGMVDKLEKRMARQMFKQAVELAKIFWLVVKGFHINPEDVDDFHRDCVEEVKRINGVINFPFRSKNSDKD